MTKFVGQANNKPYAVRIQLKCTAHEESVMHCTYNIFNASQSTWCKYLLPFCTSLHMAKIFSNCVLYIGKLGLPLLDLFLFLSYIWAVDRLQIRENVLLLVAHSHLPSCIRFHESFPTIIIVVCYNDCNSVRLYLLSGVDVHILLLSYRKVLIASIN